MGNVGCHVYPLRAVVMNETTETREQLVPQVTGFVHDAAGEYVVQVGDEWRAIVAGAAYCGFESRLEALVFAGAKWAELAYRSELSHRAGARMAELAAATEQRIAARHGETGDPS